MKLAVSSIAWKNEEEETVAGTLQRLGVKHVELAPTKIWDDPTAVSADKVQAVVKWWQKYDIEVSAFQSMLFARPDLKIFESAENRKECKAYLSRFMQLAANMGARRLVFGSPKNRQKGAMRTEEARMIAADFFTELGSIAERIGVVLCLEPNAPQYNCDFIITAAEGASLVRHVNNAGFGLHLDTACMTLSKEDMMESITSSGDVLQHFHISAPMLGQVGGQDDVDHGAAATALRSIGYDKLVSIEMRPDEAGQNIERIERAVRFVQNTYF